MRELEVPRSRRSSTGISRRSLLSGTAAAASLPLAWSDRACAAQGEDAIRIGFVSPRTGGLGVFGEGDGFIVAACREALKGGLNIGGKTFQVDLLDRDSQSDPTRAGQLAKSLITEDKIDLMLATSTPEVVNPVADACEAAGVPCLSTVMPWEAWYFGRGGKAGQPSPFKWTYHFSFGAAQFSAAYISEWGLIPTNKKVGVMYPNDADGNGVRGFLPALLQKAGYAVVDPGPFEDGTTDYSAQIAVFLREQCEIIDALMLPPDFATFWRQAAQQGLTRGVKLCQIEKAGASPVEIEVLGKLGYGLCTTAPWNPTFPYKSPATGLTSQEMADKYEASSGKQVTKQLGSSMAVFDAGLAALRNSGNPHDKAAVSKAISVLKVQTTIGLVDFNTGPMPHVVAVAPLVSMQYQKAPAGGRHKITQVIVESVNDPNVPVGGKLSPYGA